MKRYFLVGTVLVIALLALTAFVASGPQAPTASYAEIDFAGRG